MKNIFNFLYSTRLMAVLFILFATSMGVATFIENDFGTQTSKALVYNTWWFETIMVFFVINFFGNIFRYRLYKKEKWAVLMFHLAFLFIIIGAGVTRYVGYEGIMLINEGETTNQFLSETNYVNVIVDDNKDQKTIHKPILLSAWGSNSWGFSDDFREKEYKVDLVDYIPWAEKKLVEDKNGVEHLFLVESSSGSRHEHYIKSGTVQNIHNILVGYNSTDNNASINIFKRNDSLKIVAKSDGNYQIMATQATGSLKKDSIQDFKLRALYNVAGLPFVAPNEPSKGTMQTISGPKDDKKLDVIILDVTSNNETKRVELSGGKYNNDNFEQVSVNDLNFRMWYGSKILETPFSVKLNDFQLEKYPGSESAASYASEVTVIDAKESFDFRIFMNHILDHKGYKFFQSSYDLSGEKEQTHLSVNHDFWGTFITYFGYSLLYTGLICILFAKHTRFDDLKNTLKKIRKKKLTLSVMFAVFLSSFSYSQQADTHQQKRVTDQQIDSILKANEVSLKHAEKFNKLVIQDAGGRMKPAHTFASELVRKVSQSEVLHGMQPSQVLLSILESPRLWFEVPAIYLEKGNTKIREIIGVEKDAKYARLSDFYDERGQSKIDSYITEAQKKNIQNKFEKDVIKIGRRLWLFTSALSGNVLKIYPIPGDENNKWISHPEVANSKIIQTSDSLYIPKLLPLYMQLLQTSKRTGDYTKADQILDGIKNYQKKYGAAVYPSESKIDLEITYNKLGIFKLSAFFYLFLGLLLIFIEILKIFYYKSKVLTYIIKGLITLILLSFIFHTFGLASRWYISGNAPWSNAYESIIYVAWATMLFGLYLGRKSALTIGATTFLAAIILLFAHQNWLDPEIANLQPVLNSWWLLVHVSIIVASYGPFSLGMILGIVSLILIAFTTEKNKKRMDVNIKELTIINEMAVTVGLVMLTIGNFLGGMWANESWGRYWGWDPKETWALISIMIYAFVLHMRLIPGLRGRLSFNFASAFAYLSIMMTYFGVNFYLSGLHSYASGDKAVTPKEAFIYIGFIIALLIFASIKYKKYYKK
ncbi:cytochrome c-type biogenesis protein CcsB [Polaribacter sp. KT25b]|uniref:cytochrome c biogenesis protein CcsA n=1 Tax=Polaribacter sp. KT25b TaxID=1855336 RepID=UPI00087CEBD8|nr:cytochrome c biogenesis protein CcsA [Polaribacter sp. KT25b]SDS25728.1 cytochrome c-type biogenesis protein CcsB [Polaribacter sp. KT25b]